MTKAHGWETLESLPPGNPNACLVEDQCGKGSRVMTAGRRPWCPPDQRLYPLIFARPVPRQQRAVEVAQRKREREEKGGRERGGGRAAGQACGKSYGTYFILSHKMS